MAGLSGAETIAYLIEENRLLRRQLCGRRLRLTDDDRRRLAAIALNGMSWVIGGSCTAAPFIPSLKQ